MSKIFGGRYEVIDRIGAGGMAIVYKAKDLLLNRVVTIKVLREQFVSDEDFIRRFRREAQSAASLSHPNIVSVYDVGKEGDMEYIVMEYVEGRNLKEIIREYAPLSTEQSINLGRQITKAIQNAHEHHIIHRDIKPHNILVTSEGHAKVTDFGIARAVSSATVTHTGDIIGSVHYLSPEQAKGLVSNEQSDIYSLGIVLYELVTGRVPYDGETPITIALKHLQEQPTLPSKINPRVDKEFETVIMRAIAKSPEQRYLSAKDLLEDLNHIQAGRPITKVAVIPLADDSEATQTHKGMATILGPIPPSDPAQAGEPSSPVKKKQKKHWKWMALVLGLMFFLFGGLALSNFLADDQTKVPNVVQKTVEEAGASMKAASLTLDPMVASEFSDTIEKDHIISQDPKAADIVKIKRAVKVTVSKGADTAQFPDVTSGQMSKDNAEITIGNAGFDIKKITYDHEPNDNVPKGSIIAQNPAAKATWAKSGAIKLTISDGSSLHEINMPNVVGKTASDARAVLEENQLVVQIQSENSGTFPNDVVLRTTPNPGEVAMQGTEVTIVVSLGPGPLAQAIDPKVKLASYDPGTLLKNTKIVVLNYGMSESDL
ncbi:MAG TPA: Stk1 family PASTA domain-containing Ser/Thr kinase [Desulfosporosinus sp.]|nr:Stk1 family PASTA domain-containing Ser/Thr kinase [Desulfosporosinus sp.]